MFSTSRKLGAMILFIAAMALAATATAEIVSFGGNVITNQTAAADTVINVVVPGNTAGRTRVTQVKYTAGATAHSLYAMRPIGKTTLSATASASQAVINLTADPGADISTPIAANDYIVVKQDLGTYTLHKVSSVAGLAITLTENLTTKVSANQPVWFYGVVGDTDPATGLAHPKWPSGLVKDVTTTLTGDGEMLVNTISVHQPIVLQSDNATNAGTFVEVYWKYTAN